MENEFGMRLEVTGSMGVSVVNKTNLSNEDFFDRLRNGDYIINLETRSIYDVNAFRIVGLFYVDDNELEYEFY